MRITAPLRSSRRRATGEGNRPLHLVLVLVLMVALLSGCTLTVHGYGRSADAYVDPEASYTMIVPPDWEQRAAGADLPGKESWQLPETIDGVTSIVFVTTTILEGQPRMIELLYGFQQGVIGGDAGLENARINSARIVTGSAGDILGVVDYSGTTVDGVEVRLLDVMALDGVESVVASFITERSSFDALLPTVQSPLLSLHKL